ncbi:nitric oxide synthase-interacting protein [Acrasis kona]|uniref:Nitric oxide synthase-interacting protein n=1 Tax=Acrasis kona TaxID=1008807 RepID=A0AAW2Z6U5_9EUKA
MTRHSKNTKNFFTHTERSRLKEYGTNVQRLGTDSMRSFDQCHLCQKPTVRPTCTKYGYIYCKECILENILTQRKTQKRSKEEQKIKQKQNEAEKKLKEHEQQFQLQQKYEKIIEGVLPMNAVEASTQQAPENDLMEQVQHDTMFWMPGSEATSSNAANNSTPQHDKKIVDPMNNQVIRPKELVTIEFSLCKGGSDVEFNTRYMCPCCLKNFSNTNSAVTVLQECGHALCSDCFKKFITSNKEHKCVVCSKRFKKQPISLQMTGTSHASEKVSVEAKTYNPTLSFM